MEFRDVVMKRRAVRRFEDGGVPRETIEEIARLAQRAPSAGFSQGQRLIVVTDPERRREIARICGEEGYAEAGFGPWISECAAQFIPCVSEQIYHRRYQEPDKIQDDGRRSTGRSPIGGSTSARRCRTSCSPRSTPGSAAASSGPTTSRRSRRLLGLPDEFEPIGVMPVGIPVPDKRSPSLKRGWVPFEEFARWERWD